MCVNKFRCMKLVRLKTRSHSVRNIAVLNSQPFAGCSLSADVAQRFSNVPVLFRWGIAGMKWGSNVPVLFRWDVAGI